MAKKQAPGSPQSFEEQMRRLQDIVQELERADLALEKNVALYKEGQALAKSAKELLDRARHEISLCAENGSLAPFDRENGE